MTQQQSDRQRKPSRRRRHRKVLVPVFDHDPDLSHIPLAAALGEGRKVHVLGVVPVAVDDSLSMASDHTQKLRTHLRRALRKMEARLWPRIVASYHPQYELATFVVEQNVDLMVLPWLDKTERHSRVVQSTLEYAPCSIALVRGEPPVSSGSILVILRPGPDSELALRLGITLARSGDFTLSTLRLTPETPAAADERAASGIEQVLIHIPQIQDALLLADDPLQAALEQMKNYDLTILGAHERERPPDQGVDEFTRQVIARAPVPLLIACTGTACSHEPPLEQTGISAISILVDKWFAENTFRSAEFENLERLLDRKRDQGTSISLALPALNEEETVGNVIATIKGALMDEVPMLDEIVLIDSNSSDRTREIASSLDIPVYIHQEILPAYGSRHGKGEALWKSLYVTSGDIILWIDTDIVNIHPRFIYGLIGPLLHRPTIMFIKGFYLRPMRVGKSIQAGGGGRVTELTARPMLNLFYPALSGFIQPLSGEYGGRREALEKLPFSSGYGVEIGLLIDILEQLGLDALAQVDLIQRIHHNQPLTALSKMSFAIIQTVMRKLNRRYRLQLLDDVNRAMKLIRHEQRRFFLEVEQIAENERPPMISIPEYQQRFKDTG